MSLRLYNTLTQKVEAFEPRTPRVATDLPSTGAGKPTHEPRVSPHIPEIVELIESIIAKGHAYAVKTPKGHDVYFEVRSFPPYGKLSRRNIDDLLAGARVDANELK